MAPPFPGAFTTVGGTTLRVLRTRVDGDSSPAGDARLRVVGDRLFADCGGGGRLEILAADAGGHPLDAARFTAQFGAAVTPDT